MTTLILFVCLFVSDQEQYILIACDSKIEEEAIQNRVYARDVAHSEACVTEKSCRGKHGRHGMHHGKQHLCIVMERHHGNQHLLIVTEKVSRKPRGVRSH